MYHIVSECMYGKLYFLLWWLAALYGLQMCQTTTINQLCRGSAHGKGTTMQYIRNLGRCSADERTRPCDGIPLSRTRPPRRLGTRPVHPYRPRTCLVWHTQLSYDDQYKFGTGCSVTVLIKNTNLILGALNIYRERLYETVRCLLI